MKRWMLAVGLLIACLSRADEGVRLESGHTDVRLEYEASRESALGFRVREADGPSFHETTNVVLVVREAARLELPGDFPPLGQAGDLLWILPQSQSPELLYLGISAEGVPVNTFAGDLQMRLVEKNGPGEFFFWQSELGELTFRFNTRDGVGTDDVFSMLPGGHNHGNWGFTAPGVYRLTFRAEGRLTGASTNLVSEPFVFTFAVEPLPPVRTGFASWQLEHWPGMTDGSVIGPGADPDGDRRANLEEYALGTDPRVAEATSGTGPVLAVEGGRVTVEVLVAAERDDLDIQLVRRRENAAWEQLSVVPQVTPVPGTMRVRWTWEDSAAGSADSAWYRLGYTLRP